MVDSARGAGGVAATALLLPYQPGGALTHFRGISGSLVHDPNLSQIGVSGNPGAVQIALPLGIHFGLNWMQSLFGMKTQFATSIWTIVPGPEEGIVSPQFIGLGLQVLLLAIGVLLVELYIRKHPESAKIIDDRLAA